MARRQITFESVRTIAMSLPGVEDSTIHGAPSLKVRGKLLACPAIHKSAEPGTLAVRISIAQREKLLAADPEVFYVNDHYADYPTVLVRMSKIRRDALRDLLGDAWKFVSAKSKK